jgi:hypothetical protein
MNLTAWVDVAIGLTLVYLGTSLFVTVINEYIAQGLNLRGRQLCDSLKELITDKEVTDTLKQSPVLKPFFDSQPGKAPSYVDANVLGQLLVGSLAAGSTARNAVRRVSEAIDDLRDSELKTQLQALARTAGTTTDSLVKAVSDWADRSLTVLGEGYKQNLQKISFAVGFALVIVLNLDTVALTEHLYRDKDAREAAVALGAQIAEKTSKETFDKCMGQKQQERKKDTSCAPLTGLIDAVQGRNESLGKLPIGWSERPASVSKSTTSEELLRWGSRVLGWLLTALAVSLGAPFWFDLLNKLVNVRYGMRKPQVAE